MTVLPSSVDRLAAMSIAAPEGDSQDGEFLAAPHPPSLFIGRPGTPPACGADGRPHARQERDRGHRGDLAATEGRVPAAVLVHLDFTMSIVRLPLASVPVATFVAIYHVTGSTRQTGRDRTHVGIGERLSSESATVALEPNDLVSILDRCDAGAAGGLTLPLRDAGLGCGRCRSGALRRGQRCDGDSKKWGNA
jgi:hypothetical protein